MDSYKKTFLILICGLLSFQTTNTMFINAGRRFANNWKQVGLYAAGTMVLYINNERLRKEAEVDREQAAEEVLESHNSVACNVQDSVESVYNPKAFDEDEIYGIPLVFRYLKRHSEGQKINPNSIYLVQSGDGEGYMKRFTPKVNQMGLPFEKIFLIEMLLRHKLVGNKVNSPSQKDYLDNEKIIQWFDEASLEQLDTMITDLNTVDIILKALDQEDAKNYSYASALGIPGILGHELVHVKQIGSSGKYFKSAPVFWGAVVPTFYAVGYITQQFLRKCSSGLRGKLLSLPVVSFAAIFASEKAASVAKKIEYKYEEVEADIECSKNPLVLRGLASNLKYSNSLNTTKIVPDCLNQHWVPREIAYFILADDEHPHNLTRIEYLEALADKLEAQQNDQIEEA